MYRKILVENNSKHQMILDKIDNLFASIDKATDENNLSLVDKLTNEFAEIAKLVEKAISGESPMLAHFEDVSERISNLEKNHEYLISSIAIAILKDMHDLTKYDKVTNVYEGLLENYKYGYNRTHLYQALEKNYFREYYKMTKIHLSEQTKKESLTKIAKVFLNNTTFLAKIEQEINLLNEKIQQNKQLVKTYQNTGMSRDIINKSKVKNKSSNKKSQQVTEKENINEQKIEQIVKKEIEEEKKNNQKGYNLIKYSLISLGLMIMGLILIKAVKNTYPDLDNYSVFNIKLIYLLVKRSFEERNNIAIITTLFAILTFLVGAFIFFTKVVKEIIEKIKYWIKSR